MSGEFTTASSSPDDPEDISGTDESPGEAAGIPPHPLTKFVHTNARRFAANAVQEMVEFPLTLQRQRSNIAPLAVLSGVRSVASAQVTIRRLSQSLAELIGDFTNPDDYINDTIVSDQHAIAALLATLQVEVGFRLDDLPDAIRDYTQKARHALDPNNLDRVPVPGERTANNIARFRHAFGLIFPTAARHLLPTQRQHGSSITSR